MYIASVRFPGRAQAILVLLLVVTGFRATGDGAEVLASTAGHRTGGLVRSIPAVVMAPQATGDEQAAVPETLEALPKVFQRVADVHALSAEEAARRHPVRLEAVVTYFDRSWDLLFVQDETGGSSSRIGAHSHI